MGSTHKKKIDDLNKIILEDNNKIKNIKNKLPNVDGNCGIYENCRSCTASETCGWCSLTNACVPGTKDGPSKGQCSFFEFGSCSGPRSCDSYDKCGDCIKDVACGWCNKSGKQSRIDKKLNDSGECKEDFIHIWKNTNTCPHNKNMNKEAKFNGDDNKSALKDVENKNITLIDPKTKKRLISEMKFYKNDIEEKQKGLEDLMTVIESTKNELSKVQNN